MLTYNKAQCEVELFEVGVEPEDYAPRRPERTEMRRAERYKYGPLAIMLLSATLLAASTLVMIINKAASPTYSAISEPQQPPFLDAEMAARAAGLLPLT